jgi:hypothetical protein
MNPGELMAFKKEALRKYQKEYKKKWLLENPGYAKEWYQKNKH